MVGGISDQVSAGTRSFRAVFIDAAIHYVDERGEHYGLVSEQVNAEEDRCRVGLVTNSEPWLRVAIGLGDELLGLARRVGDVDAWGCMSGRFGGANPGPNLAAKTIKAIAGRPPPKPASGPFTRPMEGRMGTFAALDQRIATRYQLKPMDIADSARYLRHHLAIAGRDEPLFADDAIARLHRAANGLPRQLNNAATAALIAAATAGQHLVDATAARKAAAELTRD